MSEQPSSRREPDDAMARQAGAVSEDVEPVTTDEDAGTTAQGSRTGTTGPDRADEADDLETG